MKSEFAGKGFFVSGNREWFEEQVNLSQVEFAEADSNGN